MLDPYRMIVINILASIVVGAGLLIYYYIYPKKKLNLWYVLIILSLLPLLSILRKGTYESGDLSIHIKFAMQFFENLQQGNFFPEWIPRHCGGYGCPVYIFLFVLPYYLISFFHILGLSFIASIKFMIALSFFFSGIGMFLWIKNELNEKAGFVAAIFYLYSPYHLIDLHFRASIGEVLSMAFIPFIFLWTKLLIETRKPLYFVGNAILFGLIILSHQVTSFVIFPIVLLYALFVWKREKKRKISSLVISVVAIFYGILLASYYWIPILAESKFIQFNAQNAIQFAPFSDFFFSPNVFGFLFQGHHGELYFSVGYTQWIIVGISIFLLIKKELPKKEKSLLLASILLFTIFFIMMQPITANLWHILPLLKGFQFSWRLLIEIVVFISVMAGVVVTIIKQNLFTIILCVITILYTILNWGNRTMLPNVTDAELSHQIIFEETPGNIEITSPRWVDQYKPWVGKNPKSQIEILSGTATIKPLYRYVTKHAYNITVSSKNAIIKENTFYYPGWEVFANNHRLPINYTTAKYPGVITFALTKGNYTVDLMYTDTTDRKLSKLLTFISGGLLSIYVLIFLICKPKFYSRRFKFLLHKFK